MRKQLFDQINKLEAILNRAEAERERLKLQDDALDVYIDQIQKQVQDLRVKIIKGASK